MNRFLACLVLGGSLFAYGCATTTGGTGGTPPLTFSQMVSIAQLGLSTAKAGVDTLCAQPKAPTFCRSPQVQAEITASYNAAEDALTSVNTLLNTQGSTQDQVQAAVDTFIKAVNDYSSVVDAFKHGHAPGAARPMTRAEMLGRIQSLTDETRAEMKESI